MDRCRASGGLKWVSDGYEDIVDIRIDMKHGEVLTMAAGSHEVQHAGGACYPLTVVVVMKQAGGGGGDPF